MLYAFIPIGALVGKCLKEFPPVKAYSINILGSLFGVLLFSALSYFGFSPVSCLLVGTLAILPFLRKKRLHALLSVLLVCIVASAYLYEEKSNSWKNLWTPYYNLKVFINPPAPDGSSGGFSAFVNNFFLLSGVPISDDNEVYGLPYRYVRPERILVLGSGGGNDVAMALSMGASHIDAVEIDPMVFRLGKYLNPQQAYNNPKVTVYIGDARNYLKNTQEKYDLVIFGTLDSHGLFSAFSSIKMENFVYTRESFEEVKRILSPQGIIATTVGFDQIWVPLRIYSTMQQVFGKNAIVHLGISSLVTVLAGPGMEGKSIQEMSRYKGLSPAAVQDIIAKNPEISIIPTDDWPHLFLRKKKLPLEYLKIMGALLLISCFPLVPALRASKRISTHFFFLGAGFLLLETKSITELALTFGSTWITNAVVISSILFVVLLANLYVLRFKPEKYDTWYTLLLISLVLTYLIPHKSLLAGNPALQVLISSLFCGLPILFAAMIFAISFSQVSNSSEALAWNMLGCVIGGLCEYLSLPYGFRFLVLIAIGMYLLSLIDLIRKKVGEHGLAN
ncbi:MAG: hypothetical protein RDV48_27435 [Candidatus Eremiobacteraeota bacterium]|nr:hypothetical protein [Candidatus Eremiobacteraeota bacterium]